MSRLQLATLQQLTVMDVNKSGGRVRPPLRKLVAGVSNSAPAAVSDPQLQNYEDLYLTEHPYGLVCGVETDLPAND